MYTFTRCYNKIVANILHPKDNILKTISHIMPTKILTSLHIYGRLLNILNIINYIRELFLLKNKLIKQNTIQHHLHDTIINLSSCNAIRMQPNRVTQNIHIQIIPYHIPDYSNVQCIYHNLDSVANTTAKLGI